MLYGTGGIIPIHVKVKHSLKKNSWDAEFILSQVEYKSVNPLPPQTGLATAQNHLPESWFQHLAKGLIDIRSDLGYNF